MLDNIRSIIFFLAYFAVLIYVVNVLRYIVGFIRKSFSDKAINKTSLIELGFVILLGQYGIYLNEEDKQNPSIEISVKTRRIYKAVSLLAAMGISIIILPKIGKGNEVYGSLYENDRYTTYYYATLQELDENYLPNSIEMFGIAAVEKDDDSRRIKNINIKGMGTFYGYSDEDLEVLEAPISFYDISGNQYKVKILSLKPELIVKERFNTKFEATILHEESKDRQKVINEIRSGNKIVYLARDYSNEKNHNPVLVYSSYGYIGHLRSDISAQLTKILDDGGVVQAEVIEVKPQGNSDTYFECSLEIKIMSIDEKENYIYQPDERN